MTLAEKILALRTAQNLSQGDLAEKLDWWLEHPQEREACSRAYSGYARQFDFDRCMDAMEGMLLDAVQGACHG